MIEIKRKQRELTQDTYPLTEITESNSNSSRLLTWWRKNRPFIFLALPGLLHILLFRYLTLPFLVIAFEDFRLNKGIFGSKWVGLYNFGFLFGQGGKGFDITRNTISYNLVFIILGTVSALAVAILLAEVYKSRIVKLYQTAIFIPYFISFVIISYLVYAFFNEEIGMVNSVLRLLGKETPSWYSAAQYWPFILVLVNLWVSLGGSTVIYLAGILRINPEFFEAAAIDGASRWQQIRHITLPSLNALVIILTLLAIGNIFRADIGLFFQVPMIYKYPQLIRTTDVIDTFVYRSLTPAGLTPTVNGLALGTAAGLYQGVVGLVLVVLANWVVRKIDPERALF